MVDQLNNPVLYQLVVSKLGNTFVSPAGRLSYPALLKPKAMKGESEDKAKFSTSLIVPTVSKPAMRQLNELILKFAKETWGAATKEKPAPGGYKSPILAHADKCPDKDLAAKFPFLLRYQSERKPGVVFGNGQECLDSNEIYPGRWARVSFNFWKWDHPTGGKGVSFGLNNVMLLDHDERLGSVQTKAEDDFDGLWMEHLGPTSTDTAFGGDDKVVPFDKGNGKATPTSGGSLFD